MASNEETGQNAAAAVGDVNTVTNVVQNFIPLDWLSNTLPKEFHYASVVKQIFIMQAGVTVKMQRTMDALQRNMNALMQYKAWVENLEFCYPGAAITKYMRYTTKTMRKEYSGRDVFRRFNEGLQVFQNTFTPIWNSVLQGGISGKTWPEVWLIFVGKVIGTPGPVTQANLHNAEFKGPTWLLAYKFLGPPCEKLYRNKKCHELFAAANNQSARGTGTRKRKSEKLSRRDEREDYARRSQAVLKRAAAAKQPPRDDAQVMHVANVMRGVEMLASSRKNEFEMLAKSLELFGADDPRVNTIKDQMYQLLVNRNTFKEQIKEVQKNLQSTIDLTGSPPSVDMPSVQIDPLHSAPAVAPPILDPANLSPNPISAAPRGKFVDTISEEEVPISATIPAPDPVTQVPIIRICVHTHA